MKKKSTISIVFIIILGLILSGIYFSVGKELTFWKYAIKNKELTNIFSSNEISEFNKKKQENSYITNSELAINNNNNQYKCVSVSKAKSNNDKLTNFRILKNDKDFIDANVITRNDLLGIKIRNFNDNYVIVENNNLKELAKNIGIQDTSKIPEKINTINFDDLLKLEDDDIQYISKKYSKLIMKNISSNNYSKNIDKNNSTSYSLTLTENEVKKVLSELYKKISTDERVLNIIYSKLKLINIGEEKNNVGNISRKFQEMSKTVLDAETTNDILLEITVYIENNELLQTDIKIKDKKVIKIVYDKENNNLNIKQQLVKPDGHRLNISISNYLNTILNKIEEISITKKISDDSKEQKTDIEIMCNNGIDIKFYTCTKILNEQIMHLEYEDDSKVILNDLSEDELKKLYEDNKIKLIQLYEIWRDTYELGIK